MFVATLRRGAVAALLAALAAACAAGNAAAADPAVEYSADVSLETEDGTIQYRTHRAPGKDRMEMSLGESQTIIRRDDKQVTWMLMPSEQIYLEMPAGGGDAPASDRDYKMLERTAVGEETLDGLRTTKSKVVMADAKGNKFAGFWWDTPEGITVKMDAISVEGNAKKRVKMVLSNLKVERQDPALFEIPAGFQKMTMPSFPGMPGMGMSPDEMGD